MLFKLIKVSTNFDLPVFQFLDESNYSKKLSKNVKEKAIYLHRDTCLMLGHGLDKKFVLFLMMITKKLAFSGATRPFVTVSSRLLKNFPCLSVSHCSILLLHTYPHFFFTLPHTLSVCPAACCWSGQKNLPCLSVSHCSTLLIYTYLHFALLHTY